MSRRVIFDTDPGVDDAMALFFLLQSPELDAVTTVFGNIDVEQTTRNALILLDIAGRPDVPVAAGYRLAPIGLDVTLQAIIAPEQVDLLKERGHRGRHRCRALPGPVPGAPHSRRIIVIAAA